MTVQILPQTFQTTDGNKFINEAEATKHQEYLDAQKAVIDAQERLANLLAVSAKTKDGKVFDPNHYTHYYYVSPKWDGKPTLVEAHCNHAPFTLSRDNAVEIVAWAAGETRTTYRIDQLYANARAAHLGLIEEREAWLEDERRELDRLRQQ